MVDVYIDDFYGAEEKDLTNSVFERIKELYHELGLVAASEKDVAQTFEMLCLGVWVNFLTLTFSALECRIVELTKELGKFLVM